MENYLMLNGKRIYLTAEQIETLVGKKEKDPFERVEGERFYCIEYDGMVDVGYEEGMDVDQKCFDVANYCTDKELMVQRAMHEILNRLLWRYSVQHGGEKTHALRSKYWHIVRYEDGELDAFENDYNDYWTPGVVWFESYDSATNAIEEIVKPFMEKHPEFRW